MIFNSCIENMLHVSIEKEIADNNSLIWRQKIHQQDIKVKEISFREKVIYKKKLLQLYANIF